MVRYPPVEKRAVLHVHTRFSDGTGSPGEVIDTALASGVDILGINDHGNLGAREAGFGGWKGSLFVLAGTELEDSRGRSHLLAYGIDEVPRTPDTLEQLSFVRESGGLAIAAHPTESRGYLPKTGRYTWRAGGTKGLDGVEVWNYMSMWKKGISLFNAARRIREPDRYVEHPDPRAVDFWEGVGGCAIATPDAHALRFGFGRVRREVFPYRMLFGRLATHVLLEEELPEDMEEAEGRIMDALRRGSCFCSSMLSGDAAGFRAVREGKSLMLRMPGSGTVALVRSGAVFYRQRLEMGEHRIPVEAGIRFSVNVSREGRTWIHCGIPCWRRRSS